MCRCMSWETEWHFQSLAFLVGKRQKKASSFLFIQQVLDVTQVVFEKITFSSNQPGCFDQETTECALAANAKYSKEASSKTSWLVGYSRTHWSTPLSPRPTHRRLEGRQVTVDPAHTADHHCPTTGYPYQGYLPRVEALYSCKFSPGQSIQLQLLEYTFKSRQVRVDGAHSTLYQYCPRGHPYQGFLPLLFSLGHSVASSDSDTLIIAHTTLDQYCPTRYQPTGIGLRQFYQGALFP